MLANPWVLIAIAVFYAGSLGTVGYKAYQMGQEHVVATQAKERSIEDRTRDAALAVTSEAIANIKVVNEHTTQRLATETVEKPVYRDCVNSDVSYGLLNDALTAPEDRPGAGSADPGIVPQTDSPH
jgi:hypothetical protein